MSVWSCAAGVIATVKKPVSGNARRAVDLGELRPGDDVDLLGEAGPDEFLRRRCRLVLTLAVDRLFADQVEQRLAFAPADPRPVRSAGDDHRTPVHLLNVEIILKRVDRTDGVTQMKPVELSPKRVIHNRA